MIILEADNRKLLDGSKYSFLSDNYESGISSFSVMNASDSSFASGAHLMIGLFGQENSEILTISSVNNDTGVITTTTPLKFSHSESTRVSVLPYNKVRFFWTSSDTFDIANALTGYVDIQASDWFTTFNDEDHGSGYGWYIFYNSETSIGSQPSNPIPYAGFDQDSVDNILSDFFSLLNNRELKIVTRKDALSWLNEGVSIVRNKLNLTNVEFTSSDLKTLTTVPGTIEYALPSDFDHLVSLVAGVDNDNPGAGLNLGKYQVDFINLRDAYAYQGSAVRYYIRGSYIGILPTPQEVTTYKYMYLKRADRATLNSDLVRLPNGGSFAIKDFMMFRAKMKCDDPSNSATYYKLFENNMNQMIVAAVKRDANLDTWGIQDTANV